MYDSDKIRKGRETQVVLSIVIEDYLQLQCVRTFNSFFGETLSIKDLLIQIAKKPSVNIELSGGQEVYFELFLQSANGNMTHLEKDKSIKHYNLKQKVIDYSSE